LGSVCFQVARSDAARAIQIFEQQGVDDDRRNTMLGNLARDWAMQDMAQATRWAGNYPAGATRDGLFKQIAVAESKSSPLEAARRVVQQIPAGPAQLNAAMAVLHEWSLQDVAGAAAWLEQFPDGELKDFAKDEIARMSAHQASHSANDLPVMPD